MSTSMTETQPPFEAESGRQHAGAADIIESPAQVTPVHKASIPKSWDIAAAFASGPHQTGKNPP